MTVNIEQVNGNIEWLLDYGAKRKARYRYLFKSEMTDDIEDVLHTLQWFVSEEINIKNLDSMTDEKVASLIEKIARRFCGIYSPKKLYGLDKSVIRVVILETLRQLNETGGYKGFGVLNDIEQ